MSHTKESLIEKIHTRKRLDFDEALSLYDWSLLELGRFADSIRREKFANQTFFNINRHINPTNLCKDTCKFCAYSASRKNPQAYTMTHEEIMEIIDAISQEGVKEVHIVSAHNHKVTLEWYLEIFRKIKQKNPSLHVKALTAAEINFLAKHHKKSIDEIIDLMIEYGVDSMPGGGAEIFDEGVRQEICRGKVGSQDWLDIHKKWHQKGKKSNCTMLFGHIETRAHRIDHMMRLRNLQDQTGGFNAFIPLVYQTKNNFLQIDEPLSAQEILKTMAISRIVLDNIDNIKAYWATTTIGLALLAQEFGANDLDGTIQKESIQSAAGASSAGGIDLETMIHYIKDSGFVPVERDSLYNVIRVWG